MAIETDFNKIYGNILERPIKDQIFKTKIAKENWESKYRYGSETPLETFQRAARALASVEKPEEQDYWYWSFLNVLVKIEEIDGELVATGLKSTLGGRILANIGTVFRSTTLINCYVTGGVSNAEIRYNKIIPNTDQVIESVIKTQDTPDSLGNIMLTCLEQSETLKSEGGYGINFDFIRPRGSLIKGIGIKHPGVVSYMKIWDAISECIVKGDNDGYKDILKNYLNIEEGSDLDLKIKKQARKGAMLGALTCSHPDIEEFVRAKQQSGVLTKFNLSVLVTDEFMHAVENDDLFDLKFDSKIYKRIKARDLYDLIMQSNYNRAEPGVLFYDNMQKNNPLDYLGSVNAVNPCIRKGTLVATEAGLRPVEEISVGDAIQTTLGFYPVKNIEIHENCPIYRVTFSDGSFIDVSEGHIFHTQNGSNPEVRKRWDNSVRLKDLKTGDKVRKHPYKFTTNNRTDLTRDIGLLAGLYLGDGYVSSSKGELNISVNLSEDNSYIEQLFNRLGLKFRLDSGNSNDLSGKYIVRTSDGKRDNILELLGLDYSLKTPQKTFPLWWVNTNKDFIAGVIDGLICTDGNINLTGRYPQIRFKNTSKSLHEMFRHMLLLAGADYKCYEGYKAGESHSLAGRKIIRKNDIFEGQFDNDSILRFFDYIGYISHPEKNEKLKEIINTRELCGVRWKTFIESVELVGNDTVYDLYEPISDDWNTSGIVSRGCGEVPGNPVTSTVCLLGSVNLPQYIKKDRTFDLEKYKEDVLIFSRMLDNVNDLTNNPLPRYEWATKNVRQYGMGINGLGSALFMLGIPYNSKEAVEFTNSVNWWKEELTWKASALLAREKGQFPAYNEKFLETNWFNNFTKISDETKNLIKQFGVRNGKTSTNPPLGNCGSLDTKIRFSNGVMSFEDVFKKYGIYLDEPGWHIRDNIDLKVETLLGQKKVLAFFVNGNSSTKKITLESGSLIEGTSDHKVLVKIDDIKAVWKRIGDLEVGDVVISL